MFQEYLSGLFLKSDARNAVCFPLELSDLCVMPLVLLIEDSKTCAELEKECCHNQDI